ncbi:MAG: glucosyltransferase domain-containing protein [Lachnospiraceae bacterium]|nr:glucosyltransferase domain-containing protein [Lachnospiraceae bacterium]
MSFEDEVKKFFRAISRKYYVTFLAAIGCGLFAHLYQFTNKIFNYDELGQTPAGFGAGIGLGRWGLELVGGIVGAFFRTYSLPMINGMITLLFIALSACILVEVFDIKNEVVCFLMGGIIAVFPALVGTYFFMFTAPYYGFAMFLACAAGKLLIEGFSGEKIKCLSIVFGFLLLTLSTGIYQSYCSVTLCVVLISLVISFYEGSAEWKKLLFSGISYCVIFVMALGSYIGLTKISTKVSGIELAGYKGMDSMGSVNLGALCFSFIKTYLDYFKLMTSEDIYQINPIFLVNLIFIIANIVLVILVIERLRKKEEVINKIGLLLALILTPVAMFFPEVMTQARGGVYSLMVYSAVFVFILPLALYDKRHVLDSKDIIGRVLCVSVFVNILIYIWFANGNYQALQYTMYHDMAYFETLTTQVKSLDGYTPELKVALVGDHFEDPTFKAGALMGEFFDISGKLDTNISYFNNIYIWTSYLGFTPEVIEFKDSEYLSEMDEVKKMPCYPEDGSIAIIGDTVVIKTSE